MSADAITRRWVRNAADERAVANGCRFDEARGQLVIDFATKYLRLYEGDFAGQPLAPMPWQYEATMRLFGWVKHSDRWKREVRRFNRASIWIAKKNGKSPTLAWWGLYLLMFDGEQGQKVFFGAKDGAQAREIAGKHAIEMVLSSPDLLAECSINKSLMQITHEPTRSTLKPMSSGDARTQQSKEGINGSILVDEVHVVDRDFISRVSRAGISRSEPLHIEVSTAGKDVDSYGKTQFDRGLQVEAGTVHDDGFFFLSFAAPQRLTDDQLAADPVKYGKLANPAWGHTVDEAEYLADYERSKASVLDLADFKTYRLNVWQKSRSPWLRAHDWSKCASEWTAADFAGEPCVLGLDKSKTRDMTAIVATFRRDEEYFQLPYFWLPEATARSNAHLAAFLDWAAAGDLNLIPGEVIEDRYLLAKVAELHEQFRIVGIYYDRTFASDVTLAIEEAHGIERIEFPQTTEMFAGPIEDYERLVIQGQLRHPNNAVLNWQAGHCEAYVNSKGRKTLIKPRHNDIKKIDGMVAGVMSLYGAMQPMLDAPSAGTSFLEQLGAINTRKEFQANLDRIKAAGAEVNKNKVPLPDAERMERSRFTDLGKTMGAGIFASAKGSLGTLGGIMGGLGLEGVKAFAKSALTRTPDPEIKPTGAMVAGSSEAFSAMIRSMTGQDKSKPAERTAKASEEAVKKLDEAVKHLAKLASDAAGGVVASFGG